MPAGMTWRHQMIKIRLGSVALLMATSLLWQVGHAAEWDELSPVSPSAGTAYPRSAGRDCPGEPRGGSRWSRIRRPLHGNGSGPGDRSIPSKNAGSANAMTDSGSYPRPSRPGFARTSGDSARCPPSDVRSCVRDGETCPRRSVRGPSRHGGIFLHRSVTSCDGDFATCHRRKGTGCETGGRTCLRTRGGETSIAIAREAVQAGRADPGRKRRLAV